MDKIDETTLKLKLWGPLSPPIQCWSPICAVCDFTNFNIEPGGVGGR